MWAQIRNIIVLARVHISHTSIVSFKWPKAGKVKTSTVTTGTPLGSLSFFVKQTKICFHLASYKRKWWCRCSVVLGVHSLVCWGTLWQSDIYIHIYISFFWVGGAGINYELCGPIAGMFHCGTCTRAEVRFNLPLPHRVVGWFGGHLFCQQGLWACWTAAYVHAAWDAPPHTWNHLLVHPHFQFPAAKQ